ncbi:hypothetical protein TNCV_227181 [Trichonephila clavipes]|nr:hypothetical protein TNCV_227181 [Trichonephila clavipes]
MAHSIGSKPLLLKNFNLHEILNYSAKFSSATGNRSVAANRSKGLKLFDDKFVSKISFTEPDFLMNDDFFIQGFVKAEMKKKVTYKPSVQIRTTCQKKEEKNIQPKHKLKIRLEKWYGGIVRVRREQAGLTESFSSELRKRKDSNTLCSHQSG